MSMKNEVGVAQASAPPTTTIMTATTTPRITERKKWNEKNKTRCKSPRWEDDAVESKRAQLAQRAHFRAVWSRARFVVLMRKWYNPIYSMCRFQIPLE